MKLLLVSLLLAGSVAAQSRPDPEAEIRTIRQQSNNAIAQHDLQRFAETLSADFVMVRGSGIFVPTKDAYLDLFRQDFTDAKSTRYVRTPEKVQISSAAPLAAEHGHWLGINADGSVAYRGTYLAIWRHEKDGWKVRSELFVVLSCGAGNACRDYAAGHR